MSEINMPTAPGYFISKWREEGPVTIETLTLWREEMNWTTWLPLAEAALFLDAAELLALIQTVLSPAEEATLNLVRRRMLGDHRLETAINEALEIARAKDTRDLALEGRLRMERGLSKYEQGDNEGAAEDLAWAETRLKSVAKASRDHDLSLINKAAYHVACGESLMALTTYSEIARDAGHAHETVAISRLGASRIRAGLGHMFDAARHAWNAHNHAILAHQTQMAVEAGALFLDFSSASISADAKRMKIQVLEAKPRSVDDDEPTLSVHPDDIDGVFDWCCKQLPESTAGEDRPDLRAMLTLSHRLDRLETFDTLLKNPDDIEDPMLAAVAQSCLDDEVLKEAWGVRLATLTML
ncbi:MAG: hypothetical protein OSA38_04715 [Candidatus Poseidoniaceae archaeon]|nr:hypothetical protein [Candidatus Poseidoniaceae archaeon]